jgi:hypothetical protein
VQYPEAGPGEHAQEFVATKREAARLAREGDGDFRLIEVPTDKTGLIKFLNDECS